MYWSKSFKDGEIAGVSHVTTHKKAMKSTGKVGSRGNSLDLEDLLKPRKRVSTKHTAKLIQVEYLKYLTRKSETTYPSTFFLSLVFHPKD